MKPGQSSDSTALKTLSIYCLLALIGYIIADLAIVSHREQLFPLAPPAARQRAQQQVAQNSRGTYNVIADRNIFNNDKKIPPPFGSTGGTDGTEPGSGIKDAPPVPTNLPITLLGTIVHANPLRSVATLGLKSKNDQVAVRVDSDIESMAVVTKIERNRVEFRNSATQRLEFVEIKDDTKISLVSSAPVTKQVGEVKQKSDTEFELKRDDVNKLTSNLPELLQQARAVPRMGPNGQIECFSLADIAPGSIYERLGLKRGDCIGEVNGEKIDSPGKAMDMYNALRSGSAQIQIGVDRGGRKESFNYQITQ